MALHMKEFDGSFELEAPAREQLFARLRSEAFCAQVAAQVGCNDVTFLELVFQPVPYSTDTPHGMAREFEPYYFSNDHGVINVPANFMFQARITRPNRLCAIYRKTGLPTLASDPTLG